MGHVRIIEIPFLVSVNACFCIEMIALCLNDIVVSVACRIMVFLSLMVAIYVRKYKEKYICWINNLILLICVEDLVLFICLRYFLRGLPYFLILLYIPSTLFIVWYIYNTEPQKYHSVATTIIYCVKETSSVFSRIYVYILDYIMLYYHNHELGIV